MKFLTRLAVLFYVTTILFIGVFLLLFVMNQVSFRYVVTFLYVIYSDPQIRWIFGVIAVVILLKNFMFARVISEQQQREKTIAFDNPSGRVSVSLLAMSDLVRRVISKVPEVKEVKSSIAASKKGLEISVRLVLRADVNIPEMTSELQEMVKKKIQSTIGLDEAIVVKVHVSKIIPENGKNKQEKTKDTIDTDESQGNIPFQGYRP